MKSPFYPIYYNTSTSFLIVVKYEKTLSSHVIHIMSTIPSVVNSGNPHNSFQSSLARFHLAPFYAERWDSCTVSGSYTCKCSSDCTRLYGGCPNEQRVYETHLTNVPSDRFLPYAEWILLHGPTSRESVVSTTEQYAVGLHVSHE